MKKCVLKDNDGFTMIEMLLSILFLLIIVSIIPFLFKSIYTFKEYALNHSDYEILMFRKDLSSEVKDAKIEIKRFNQGIKFEHNSNTTEYTLLNSKIFKSINGKGHITLLNNVEDITIQKISNKTYKMLISIRKADKVIREEIYF